KSLHPKTARERDYIAAVVSFYRHPGKKDDKRQQNYLKDMEKLHRRYPDDHEAAAFYAFALKDSDRDDDPTHAKRKEAAAILEKLLLLEPYHPGVAHYLIHTYDYPGMAELGLPERSSRSIVQPEVPTPPFPDSRRCESGNGLRRDDSAQAQTTFLRSLPLACAWHVSDRHLCQNFSTRMHRTRLLRG